MKTIRPQIIKKSISKTHEFIPLNRNEIIKTMENDDNDNTKLKLLLCNSGYGSVMHSLFDYCCVNNDEEILEKIIIKFKNYNFWHNYGLYMGNFIRSSNNIIDILLKKYSLTQDEMHILLNQAIKYDNIYLTNKLYELGCKPNNNNVFFALLYGTNECAKSIINNCDNLQQVFEEYVSHITMEILTIDKIKYITSFGIDINEHLNIMMLNCMYDGANVDVVIYLHELGATVVNETLRIACKNNNIFLMKYFLDKNIKIDINDMDNFIKPKYETIKLLLGYDYNFSDTILEHIISFMLKYGNIKDVECMFDQFDNLNLNTIIENDEKYVYELNKNVFNNNTYPTILNSIIYNDQIEKLKFIIKHNYENLDINKLFIIASCNGQIEMAKLLLDVNNNIDYDFAFECACYFGNYDMALYLLKYDININNNMMRMCVYGQSSSIIGYKKILSKCKMSDDNYKCDCKHIEIIKLLIDLGLKLSDEMFENMVHIGDECYDIKIISHLVDNNGDVNIILDFYMKTIYKSWYNLDIVKYLLDKGAKPNMNYVKDARIIELLENYK